MIAQVARQTGGSVRAGCAALELTRSSCYHADVPTPTQSADAELGPLKRGRLQTPPPPLWLPPHRRGTLRPWGGLCPHENPPPHGVTRFTRSSTQNFLPRTSDGKTVTERANLKK